MASAVAGAVATGQAPPEAPSPQPLNLEPPDITHGLRVGGTVAHLVGPRGRCDGCWFPSGQSTGQGARLDYLFQKGQEAIRWHLIASVSLLSAQSTYPVYIGPNQDTTGRTSEFLVAGFLGTGIRIDQSPRTDSAVIIELDGTIGASSAPHFGLLGAHLALGGRIAKHWELMFSLEGEIGGYQAVGTALMLGYTF